jgi:hypothetical protein
MRNQISVPPTPRRAPRASRIAAPTRGPQRAPALHFVGHSRSASGARTIAFRLPCPPALTGPLGTAAAERRVRKAYFATLDALRTGDADPARLAALSRLVREIRSATTRVGLLHLLRAQRFVHASSGGWPAIPALPLPLERVVVTVPAGAAAEGSDALATRYAWALDWLRTHRWVGGARLVVEWRTADAAAPAVASATRAAA